MLLIENIFLNLDESEDCLPDKIAASLNLAQSDLLQCQIFKKSIDARNRSRIRIVYSCLCKTSVEYEEEILKKSHSVSVKPFATPGENSLTRNVGGKKSFPYRPIVVGTGPAGLFAALRLIQSGISPILLERGQAVDIRVDDVKKFMTTGELHSESNIAFGEGGAGTFSDGKLYTQVNHPRIRDILQTLVDFQAPAEILYLSKPHIGTDLLRGVIQNIRHFIIEHGGEVRFQQKLTDIHIHHGKLAAVEINHSMEMDALYLILAIGHSARDTILMLHKRQMQIEAKPFAMGVRIEHKQSQINVQQYGQSADHPSLGAAEYKLVHHPSPHQNGQDCYTFCMCPGGVVVPAASEPGHLVTNGMSYHNRAGTNANSALLVPVTPRQFGPAPLDGLEYQRSWEAKAFLAGGRNFFAPVQRVHDFLRKRPSSGPGDLLPSYTPGVTWGNLWDVLPPHVAAGIQAGLKGFDAKMRGFAHPDAILTALESRSSAPVRIRRGTALESSIAGVYAAGEGAGYAGGIISAALDGIRVAEAIIQKMIEDS